ncbi:MAG TPA: hypothetical protein VFF53_04375 [Geobacteraceae bacterium]|nr:hypothetical protein [Geobacteraceae bacterium]
MKVHRVLLLLFLLPSACAENRVTVDSARVGEYVEVSNPAFTLSPGAPATIWVPRNSVDQGVPRVGDVLQTGYRSLVDGIAGARSLGTGESGHPGRQDGVSPREQLRENQFR